MSDIFISYASADRKKARAIAERLEQEGWDVWWDSKIVPGQTFDRVLEEALDAAKCVVVLWSENSKKSDWVRNEATVGNRRNILVPAYIEAISLPLEFMRIQTANLLGWENETSESELDKFLDAIERVLTCHGIQLKSSTGPLPDNHSPGVSDGDHHPFRLEKDSRSSFWRSGIRVMVFSIIAGLILLGLFNRIYPQTRLTEATTTIIILSILLALGINWVWVFWRSKKRAK